MTKSKLKTGMVVECRNGYRYMVFGDKLIRVSGQVELENYTNNLNDTVDSDWDIVKVFEMINSCSFDRIFNDENLKLIWERGNNKKDKLKQLLKEILEEL